MKPRKPLPWCRGVPGLIVLFCLMAANSAGASFPMEIDSELNEMDIKLSPVSIGNQAIVLVENNEDFQIECTGWFRNGPEREQKRIVPVGPKQRRQLAVQVGREPVVVRVRVECVQPGSSDRDEENQGELAPESGREG